MGIVLKISRGKIGALLLSSLILFASGLLLAESHVAYDPKDIRMRIKKGFFTASTLEILANGKCVLEIEESSESAANPSLAQLQHFYEIHIREANKLGTKIIINQNTHKTNNEMAGICMGQPNMEFPESLDYFPSLSLSPDRIKIIQDKYSRAVTYFIDGLEVVRRERGKVRGSTMTDNDLDLLVSTSKATLQNATKKHTLIQFNIQYVWSNFHWHLQDPLTETSDPIQTDAEIFERSLRALELRRGELLKDLRNIDDKLDMIEAKPKEEADFSLPRHSTDKAQNIQLPSSSSALKAYNPNDVRIVYQEGRRRRIGKEQIDLSTPARLGVMVNGEILIRAESDSLHNPTLGQVKDFFNLKIKEAIRTGNPILIEKATTVHGIDSIQHYFGLQDAEKHWPSPDAGLLLSPTRIKLVREGGRGDLVISIDGVRLILRQKEIYYNHKMVTDYELKSLYLRLKIVLENAIAAGRLVKIELASKIWDRSKLIEPIQETSKPIINDPNLRQAQIGLLEEKRQAIVRRLREMDATLGELEEKRNFAEEKRNFAKDIANSHHSSGGRSDARE